MVIEAWQNYVNVVSGITKASRQRARDTAKAMLAQAGLEEVAADAGERVSKLAEEIMAASKANRELLENLIGAEVDKAVAKLGFARAEDLTAIRDELAELRRQLGQSTAAASAKPAAAKKAAAKQASTPPPMATAPAKKAAARQAAVKKAAKKAPVKKTVGTRRPPAGTDGPAIS